MANQPTNNNNNEIKQLIREYNSISWEPCTVACDNINNSKILTTDFISESEINISNNNNKNRELFLRMRFKHYNENLNVTYINNNNNTDNINNNNNNIKYDELLFSVSDFTLKSLIPFSDTISNNSNYNINNNINPEIILNLDDLHVNCVINNNNINNNNEGINLENVFTDLFGRLITNTSNNINNNIKGNIMQNNIKGNIMQNNNINIINSLTYKSTFFFLRYYTYKFKSLAKVNMKNCGPHLTLRLRKVIYNNKKYLISYIGDKIKGNNINKGYNIITRLFNKKKNKVIGSRSKEVVISDCNNNSKLVIKEV
ncbi:hypothetical protein CDIK_1745 [Cucumispora dikerogammari]|nr:hypothetical protein CDIK_1745 [Cucumispora dikerogammari]